MIYEFPEYYELKLNEFVKKNIKKSSEMKKARENMAKLRSALQNSRGLGMNYNKNRAFLYSVYFWPLNFYKFMYFLEILHEKTDLFSRKKISISDIGCGTGGFFSALVFFMNKYGLKTRIDYLGIDVSLENLKTFKKLFLNSDFKNFIDFPVKFGTMNEDFMEMEKLRKKDLIICSNVFAELKEEEHIEFFKRIKRSMRRDVESFFVFSEPVSRKKNRLMHIMSRGFIFENEGFTEISPAYFKKHSDDSALSNYFETIYFKAPEIWEEFGINSIDTDFVHRIISNKTPDYEGLDFRDMKEIVKEKGDVIDAVLMTKDIYRKPKAPWRFKVTDGKNNIDFLDMLIYDEEQYRILMDSKIGTPYRFKGEIQKENHKKKKSKYSMNVEKIEKI